jgi:formylglycine-generating enzyme required for sulfatase activity
MSLDLMEPAHSAGKGEAAPMRTFGRTAPGWLAGLAILLLGWAALSMGRQALWTVRNARLHNEVARLQELKAARNWQALANRLDQNLVRVPAGQFWRGSGDRRADERPKKQIVLDAFEIDRFETTNVQYQRFVQATGEKPPPYWTGEAFPPGQEDYPVVGVSWEQANRYCRWAGRRLPTEAEWEKACRGTDGRLYPWGDSWEAGRANVDPLSGSFLAGEMSQGGPRWIRAWSLLQATPAASGERGLRPVGSYLQGASPYGILDLAGNASEWVADRYTFTDYSGLPTLNPSAGGSLGNHALRGSAWYDPTGSPAWQEDQSRCAARNSSHTAFDLRVGFRCAWSP